MGLMGARRAALLTPQPPVPTLDLNFMTGALDSRITFTRASAGWYWNSSGVLTSAATDVPRFETGGFLIEPAATNLFAGDLTNATNWPAVGSVTRAAGVTAPDASANGVTLTEPAGGTTSYGCNSVSTTITASTATTGSIFVKAGTATWVRLLLADAAAPTISAQGWFNLSTGALGTINTQAGSPTGISGAIVDAGGGWWRCALTATLGASTTGFLLVRIVSADSTSSDTGSKTLSLFGPQIEVGAFASSPIITTTASATRAADVTSVTTLTPWYNAASGTLLTEYSLIGVRAAGTQIAAQLNDATQLNRISHFATNTSGLTTVSFDVAGGAQFAYTGPAPTAGAVLRHATAWQSNDAISCRNGVLSAADTSVNVPTVTQLVIGHRATDQLFGYARRLRYFPRRLENAILQRLTS